MSSLQAPVAEQTHAPSFSQASPVPFSHVPALKCIPFLSQFNHWQGADLDKEVEFACNLPVITTEVAC